MAIEHDAIADGERHEPKGISTATSGHIYVADGLGSGSWSGELTPAFGQMSITNNATAIAVTAATDTDLYTDSDFTKLTGAGAPWASIQLEDFTFNTDRLICNTAGTYYIDVYMVVSHSVNNVLVGMKYSVNDTTPFIARTPAVNLPNLGKKSILTGCGIGTLAANDYVSLYIASDTTGNVTIHDATFVIHKLKA